MSSRSIYLRDQAAKCEWHADNIRDVETQAALRKLAAKYVAEAESPGRGAHSTGSACRREPEPKDRGCTIGVISNWPISRPSSSTVQMTVCGHAVY